MTDLNQKLQELFHLSDGLLLPDEIAIQNILDKQKELKDWDEDIVLQGLITMKEFLHDLARQNIDYLINLSDEMDWKINEDKPNQNSSTRTIYPSIWEMTRHLSNWMKVFIPPVQALELQGDKEIINCLELNDTVISTLAAIMLEYEEFNYLGSYELFNELLNTRQQTILRLEIGRRIYTRYDDLRALKNETIPNLIDSEAEFNSIFEREDLERKFSSYIRELVVWDIATSGKGPRSKWPSWWE